MKFLITGGSGFIGSAIVRYLIKNTNHKVLNLDNLTYAGNKFNLKTVGTSKNYSFIKGDICDKKLIQDIFNKYRPNIVMHLAAESHVDNSIKNPENFIRTNIFGTYNLLNFAKEYWYSLNDKEKSEFIFHHISTDEVYGSLDSTSECFGEDSKYNPSSPYAASKASADHLVMSWNKTYQLPILITNCSNNYGPYQYHEKLIPLTILNALNGINIPIYKDGLQVRDWLFVEDHAEVLYKLVMSGKINETYNIGGDNQLKNIDVVNKICEILDYLIHNKPKNINSYKELIMFVKDRPGHDERYGINNSKISRTLCWKAKTSFENGLKKTVSWYVQNMEYYSLS